MMLTDEQKDIISSSGNIKINAVAGSGKTTTLIEYAKARPRNCKILYLAFNKSVKLEAANKFNNIGLYNVKVETAHSLAYKNIVFNGNYKIKSHGYKTHEITELLRIKNFGDEYSEFIIANFINKFMLYFCNSDKEKVTDLNYLDIISDKKSKLFVSNYYNYIVKQTRLFLGKMDRSEIAITHDFYLKKFQLSKPKLHYDYILFDEGQDASAAMLNVFYNQKSVKVLVGDTHQQIYGWRFAINSLEKSNFKNFNLSKSFRFSQDIADLAMEILKWKKKLNYNVELNISGVGISDRIITKAVIARTNLGLLQKAIAYVTEKKKVKKIYFEGNISSYTYADEGASLYDVLNLYIGKHRLIKDKLIKKMKTIKDLNDYIDKTEDIQLKMMIDIVKEYGNDIPKILETIKNKHVDDNHKDEAEIIFSTVHRCKGMEYDAIQIVNDFITEEKMDILLSDKKINEHILTKINEEINLIYVAITRTKNRLYLPDSLIKDFYNQSKHIYFLPIRKKDEKNELLNHNITKNKTDGSLKKDLTNNVANIRTIFENAYKPWTKNHDEKLSIMYTEGITIKDLSKHFKRSRGAIKSRIEKLQLDDKEG